jgi:membrane associated rhomboid family serine protease
MAHMAIVYPSLAVVSCAIDGRQPRRALRDLLGASGAVSGLAGMYSLCFPIQRVTPMIAYVNLWLLTRSCASA